MIVEDVVSSVAMEQHAKVESVFVVSRLARIECIAESTHTFITFSLPNKTLDRSEMPTTVVPVAMLVVADKYAKEDNAHAVNLGLKFRK